MLAIELSGQAKKFLKKIKRQIAFRLIMKIEGLKKNPFPQDAKRVINRRGKIFRVRVGAYRIQYVVLHKRKLLFVTEIEKRPRAYRK